MRFQSVPHVKGDAGSSEWRKGHFQASQDPRILPEPSQTQTEPWGKRDSRLKVESHITLYPALHLSSHADPQVIAAITAAAADGTSFGAPTEKENVLGHLHSAQILMGGVGGPGNIRNPQVPVAQCPPESQREVNGPSGGHSANPGGVGSIHVDDPDFSPGSYSLGEASGIPEHGPGAGEHRLRLGDGLDGPVEEELAVDLARMEACGKDERDEEANGAQGDAFPEFLEQKNTRR